MTRAPVVAVFGLSGVGKSWLIARYAEQVPVLHVQASQLLRDAKAALLRQEVTSEELRKGAVLDNQALLIDAFAQVRATAQMPVVFDGHSVVDTGDQLLEIPAQVIAALCPSMIVFVESDATAIIERRRNDVSRERPARSVEEIQAHQSRAREICRGYAKTLQVPLKIIGAGDEKAFAVVVATIIGSR
jgi:adenylate kinase